MRRLVSLLLAVLVALILYTGAALGQTTKPPGTLDAENLDADPDAGWGIWPGSAAGQTFTAKQNGKLTGAQVLIGRDVGGGGIERFPGDLTVEVANVDGASGLPATPEDVLASATIRDSNLPPCPECPDPWQPVYIVFDSPASVEAGEQYALILKVGAPGTTSRDFYILALSHNDSYSEGEAISQRSPFETTPPGVWQILDPGSDFIFGIYVDPSPAGPSAPKTKEDCKKDGYKDFGFKNQGQCIKYVNKDSK